MIIPYYESPDRILGEGGGGGSEGERERENYRSVLLYLANISASFSSP